MSRTLPRLHRWATVLVLVALLPGLGHASASPITSTCPPAPPAPGAQFSLEPRKANELVVDAEVSLTTPSAVRVEYGTGDNDWFTTPISAASLAHEIPLLGLKPEKTYVARAMVITPEGCPELAGELKFSSGPLPTELQRIRMSSTGPPPHPLLFMDLRVPGGKFRWLIVLDRDGEIVWYYPLPRRPGAAGIPLSDGNFIALPSQENVATILTPGLRIVNRIALTAATVSSLHHDVLELPDGRLLFIAAEKRFIDDRVNGGSEHQSIRGDAIFLYDRATEFEERIWGAFDTLDPTDRPDHWRNFYEADEGDDPSINWTHTNSLSLGEGGNLLVSMRNLDQVISLTPDFKRIEWRLGGPASTIRFATADDRFWGQHSVAALPGNRIILFDNGTFRPTNPYSRGIELQLDFSTMTARRVFEYRAQPDIESSRLGNIIRLANGNTLINFGFRSDDPAAPLVLVETQPDGGVAWTQSISHPGGSLSRYRAYPLQTLGGVTRAAPTPILASSPSTLNGTTAGHPSLPD